MFYFIGYERQRLLCVCRAHGCYWLSLILVVIDLLSACSYCTITTSTLSDIIASTIRPTGDHGGFLIFLNFQVFGSQMLLCSHSVSLLHSFWYNFDETFFSTEDARFRIWADFSEIFSAQNISEPKLLLTWFSAPSDAQVYKLEHFCQYSDCVLKLVENAIVILQWLPVFWNLR